MSFVALREGGFFPDYLIGCFLKAVFLFFTHIFFANMNHSCFIKAVTGRNFAKKWSQGPVHTPYFHWAKSKLI